MKKLLHIVLLSTLFCSFAARTSAKVTDVTELFGEWSYTATVTFADGVTDDQKALIKSEGTAIFKKEGMYDCYVTGFLGANFVDGLLFKGADNFYTANPNGNSGDAWDNKFYFSNEATKNPWGGGFDNWKWTISEDGKTITVDDICLVSCGYTDETAKPIATITNATLTFIKAVEVEAIDLTGDWKFTASAYNTADNRFPHEFDMKLTAKDETYKTYDATLDFGEEYTEQTFENVTFNGVTLTIPLGSKRYLNDTLSLAQFTNNQTLFNEGVIEFDKTDNRTLSLRTMLTIESDTTVVDEQGASHETTKYIQYYTTGTAKKAVSYSFEGTYVVTVDEVMDGENTSGFEYPTSFEFTIISGYNEDIGDYLTFSNFMGADLNYQGSVALSENDPYVLELGTGAYSLVYQLDKKWLGLLDGEGESKSPVTITYNEEDGTLSISDFSFAYYDYVDGQGLVGVEAYYTNATIVKKGEEAPEKWEYLGDYTMNATVTTEAAAADYADFDFAESSKLTVGLWNGGEPTLISTFMNADAAGLNYGGLMVTVDEQVKTLSFNGGLVYFNNDAGKQLSLRDADKGTNPLVITYNADGTITMSDFTIVDKEGNLVATCTNVTLTRGSSALKNVSSDRKAAVYAADGVIYIAGEPTRVEVYSISGAQEYSGITNEIGGLKRGFYLVKANGSTSKVIVR